MKELGFSDAQIGGVLRRWRRDQRRRDQYYRCQGDQENIKDHFAALAADMTGSCTLTLFVTDHGTGYNAEQGYKGARPALRGEDATGGTLFAEGTFKFDARKKVYRQTESFELNGNSYFVRKENDGTLKLYKRVDGSWQFLGKNDNGDTIISETEASNEFVAGEWKEMGRDTNGDFMIDGTDGGVDWNLDGDKDDQIGFLGGINLWGKEVLLGQRILRHAAAAHRKGRAHRRRDGLLLQRRLGAATRRAGGERLRRRLGGHQALQPNRRRRDDLRRRREGVSRQSRGNRSRSWVAAGTAAAAADDAATGAGIKNQHTHWEVRKYVTASVFRAEGNNEYTLQIDIPDELQGQVYVFEFILGLQIPRWTFVGFPQSLPACLDSELVPGGIRLFGSQPIADNTQIRIKVTGAVVTNSIRIDYTNVNHDRLGYTMAMPGTIAPPATVTLGVPLLCIDHFNPNHPQSNSTIEWLFRWTTIGTLTPAQTQATLQVTPPGGSPTTVMSTLGNSSLYFLFGINVTGMYPYRVLSMRDTVSNQELIVNGATTGTVNVMFPPSRIRGNACRRRNPGRRCTFVDCGITGPRNPGGQGRNCCLGRFCVPLRGPRNPGGQGRN